MHVAEPAARLNPTRTSSGWSVRPLFDDLTSVLSRQAVLLALIVGVTWLALIGAALAAAILSDQTPRVPGHGSGPSYELYEIGWAVPTAFGSLTLDSAGLNGIGVRQSPLNPVDPDEPISNPDKVQLQLSLSLSNQQAQRVAAPRAEDFRLVTTWNSLGDRVPELSQMPAFIDAQSTAQAQLTFMAPQDGSVLWLEYRQGQSQRPVRIQLGWANEIPQYATEPIPVPSSSKP
jgi:hypothetical protein